MPFVRKMQVLFSGILVLAAVLPGLTSCHTGQSDTGTVKFAYSANPNTLDVHKGGSSTVSRYVTEYLFTMDHAYTPRPMLAESHTVSEDGLLHTIKLKEGLLFHNGKEMTAGDVVASVERWLAVSPSSPKLSKVFESVEIKDEYSVIFRLSQPHADFLYMICRGTNLVIIPKELADEYQTRTIPFEKIVGTGPYKFKSLDHTRYIHLERFEEYAGREDDLGESTRRIYALYPGVSFYALPSSDTRLMGVEKGDYHIALGVDFSEYERIVKHLGMNPLVTPYASLVIDINCSLNPLSDPGVRHAIQAAIAVEPVLKASIPAALYNISPGYMPRESAWYSEAGSDYYNQGNVQKARNLLEEAGYNGEPIILMGIGAVPLHRNSAMIIASQLRDAGFIIDLKLVEPMQYLAKSQDPQEWHLLLAMEPFQGTPAMLPWAGGEKSGSGVGESKRKGELVKLLHSEMDHAVRFEIWEELQKLYYSEALKIRIGAFSSISAVSSKLYDQ